MNESNGLKLLLSYDVSTDNVNEYRQFVLQKYVPAMQMMGFQISEAWHTAYGNAPNRLIGFVCQDMETVDRLLESEDWLTLNMQLESLVSGFSYKVVPYKGVFQL